MTHDGGERLFRAVEALERQTLPPAIIVVGSGSTDGSTTGLAARAPHVTLLQLGANLGTSAARNAGLRRAATELVLLVDHDVYLDTMSRAARGRAPRGGRRGGVSPHGSAGSRTRPSLFSCSPFSRSRTPSWTRWMILFIRSAEEVARYEAGYKFYDISRFAVHPTGLVFFPLCASLVASNEWVGFCSVARKLLLVAAAAGTVVAIGVIAVAAAFVPAVWGEAYGTSIPIVRVPSWDFRPCM